MTRNEVVENIVSFVFLCCLALAVWQPNWHWVTWAGMAIFLAGIVFSLASSTRADRERRRKGAWIAPVIMLAVAAQLLYDTSPLERPRTLLLGAGLVAAGVALFWTRRRTT